MSGSVSTNASSKISQFGLYRTIDSRTEEFLKLSKKRQIKQGCACAAVSTVITVTIVVGFLLIYEYSIVPHNRKINTKETWQTMKSESDEDISFEKNVNSDEQNIVPKTPPIQAGLLQVLSRNKYKKKTTLIGVKPANYQRETTSAPAYKINKISELKNRYIKTKEHNTTPIFTVSPSKLSFQSKPKPSANYDNTFIKKYISKMIEKYIKSYKAQIIGRGDTLAKTTTEKTTFEVVSLKRKKHKVSDVKKSPDSCMCQWSLHQIIKKIMKCAMNLGTQSNKTICQNCKSCADTETTIINNNDTYTVKSNYSDAVGKDNIRTDHDNIVAKYTTRMPYLVTPYAQTKLGILNNQYVKALQQGQEMKIPSGGNINNLDSQPTEAIVNNFNATNVYLPKQIIFNSMRDKPCTFFKDYLARFQKNRMYQSQISDFLNNQQSKINDSFTSDISNHEAPQNYLTQNPVDNFNPTLSPVTKNEPERIFNSNEVQSNYQTQHIKSTETHAIKQIDLNKHAQVQTYVPTPKPIISTTENYEEANFLINKHDELTPNTKFKKIISLFEQDAETVPKIKPKARNPEQEFNFMQTGKYADEEDDDADADDDDDDFLSMSQIKNTNNNSSIATGTSFVSNEVTPVQEAEYNVNNKQQIPDDVTTDHIANDKQFKWYKKHQVKYRENRKPDHKNNFFDQLTRRFNAAIQNNDERSDPKFKENLRNSETQQQSVFTPAPFGKTSYLDIIKNYRFQPSNQDYDNENRFNENDYLN